MKNNLPPKPYKWLQEIERRASLRAKVLPSHKKIEPVWRGIAFRLGETFLVTSINEIREIIPSTGKLAKVPGAKSWVKGLANIRGLLLPVIDLNACLEGQPITIGNHTRILIINQLNISAGLLIDEVLCIQQFPEYLRDLDTPCQEARITPFSNGLFTTKEITWTVFNMQELAKSSLFRNAAL